jgi:sugar diacid utilization regulator
MLGVPLVVDGEVIGIIYVDNQDEQHLYTTRDVRLAQTFAGLAAIAVRQAWMYQQLAERAKIIDHQRRVLGDSALVHSRVTRAVLDGADIEEILRLIVEMLGKPVVLYGSKLDVISWSAPDSLGLTHSPGLTGAQLALPWVRRTTVLLRASPELRCRRLFVRMVVDRQCAGYVELCELGRGFGQADAKALEQAAMAVALKLVTVARNAEVLRREREDYLADLLYGRRDGDQRTAEAGALGFDLDKRHVVLRLQYAREANGDAAIGKRRREAAAELVGRHLGEGNRCVAHTGVPGADLLLLEVPRATDASEPTYRAELAVAFPELVRAHGVLYAVCSDPCGALADLPSTAEGVREIAALLGQAGDAQRMVFARDLEIVRLVSQRDGLVGARRHADELLGPLEQHDAATGGGLLETLRTFVACQAHIRLTAAKLDVHENTVRYRLNRIRELSSIEPERLDALLSVAMALQVRSLFDGTPTPPPATPLSRPTTTTVRTHDS